MCIKLIKFVLVTHNNILCIDMKNLSNDKTPYSDLPPNAFWKTGVAQQSMLSPKGIYRKKFPILKDSRVVTAGSCFAQHISRYLRNSGVQVVNTEPPPSYIVPSFQVNVEEGLPPAQFPLDLRSRYGYGIYSARFGNIYTMRQLLQLAQEAFGMDVPREIVWERNGSYFDALRPNVEPHGLTSPEEVTIHREHHIHQVREMFLQADIFIFTLGLTEAWVHKQFGTVYPTVPGLIAGEFSSDKYEFKNFTFTEILNDFNEFKQLLHSKQDTASRAKILLTVSPVPLTATYTGNHVLCATTYSKSVLRSVAGEIAQEDPDVDYFPSFEIINNCWSRAIFYENNMRSISKEGVDAAMNIFLCEHGLIPVTEEQKVHFKSMSKHTGSGDYGQFDDIVCEEVLVEGFLK
jgi:hypothetical protein